MTWSRTKTPTKDKDGKTNYLTIADDRKAPDHDRRTDLIILHDGQEPMRGKAEGIR